MFKLSQSFLAQSLYAYLYFLLVSIFNTLILFHSYLIHLELTLVYIGKPHLDRSFKFQLLLDVEIGMLNRLLDTQVKNVGELSGVGI